MCCTDSLDWEGLVILHSFCCVLCCWMDFFRSPLPAKARKRQLLYQQDLQNLWRAAACLGPSHHLAMAWLAWPTFFSRFYQDLHAERRMLESWDIVVPFKLGLVGSNCWLSCHCCTMFTTIFRNLLVVPCPPRLWLRPRPGIARWCGGTSYRGGSWPRLTSCSSVGFHRSLNGSGTNKDCPVWVAQLLGFPGWEAQAAKQSKAVNGAATPRTTDFLRFSKTPRCPIRGPGKASGLWI